MGRLVAVLAACLLLAGCSPATTRAIKLNGAGQPEIIDTSCESRTLTRVEIRAVNDDDVLDERDPLVWQIDFAQPRQHYTITVGRVPEGGEEKVAWQPPAGGQEHDVLFYNGDLWEPGDSFTLDELKDGKVRFQYRYLTAGEFAKERVSC
ncbi:hypothetical protein [Lentzea sp. NPDC051838]|uniref:hypothetical protein n=1 Tax=Lentzea sp. NPDC051838 TaxID=3154849 RepID=UPI003433C908